MRHWNTNPDSSDSEHYAVGVGGLGDTVLIQLGDNRGEDVRISLTRVQALHLIELLQKTVEKIS